MPSNSKYVLVLYYSRTGKTKELAELIARGIKSVNGITAKIRTVPSISETTKQTLPEVPEDGHPYASLDDVENCSGIVVGSPTRFGNMAAPLKYFIDQTSGLWMKGALINKPAGFFTSTSTMHGGQESTLLSMMIPFLHHGCLIVGIPYSNESLSMTKSGGTPYGASHVAGASNENQITQEEKNLCMSLGSRVAQLSLLVDKRS